MVLMAYLAGICTPFAAGLGVWWGLAFWARYRRSEAASERPVWPVTAPPPPSPPQGDPVVNRAVFTRSRPSRVHRRR
jgi:hypothetical protein